MNDERIGPGGRAWGTGARLGAALVVVGVMVLAVVGVAALRRDGDGPSSPSVAPSGERSSTQPSAEVSPTGRRPVPGYGFGEVALVVVEPDGTRHVLCVMTAEDAEQRQRGLMEVTDESLGGYDGMLFLFPVDSAGGFWMRNTPMPLSIAYLSAGGEIVSTTDMEPCEDSPECPSYPADDSYRSALEVPKGRLDDVGVVPGAKLEQEGACPASSG